MVCNHSFSFRQLLVPKITKKRWKRFPRLCHNLKWVSGLVLKLWRNVLECWGLWLCDNTDNIRSKKFNMAGMWPWVPKKLLKWKKAQNIPFHLKLILCNFLGKGLLFDSTSAELSSLQSIWYRCYNLCLMTCNTSSLV